jgi:hypothetical protein
MYANVDFYRIQVMGQWYEIDEPFRWDEIKVKLTRDPVLIGFNYEFVDDEIKLIFKPGAGSEQLSTLYQLLGGDASAVFQYGYMIKGTKYPQFTGNMNFNTYHISDEGVEISIEKIQFENLLRTRWETKVDFTSTLDYNNNPIVPPNPLQISLHSKEIIKKSRAEADPAGLATSQTFEDNAVWIAPDTTIAASSEISELYNMLCGVTPQVNDPISSNLNQFHSAEQGKMKWSWSASFRFDVRPVAPFPGKIGDWYMQPIIYVVRGGNILLQLQPPQLRRSGHSDSALFQLLVEFNISGIFDLLANDDVYWTVFFHSEQNVNRNWQISNYQGAIELSQQTSAPPSNCNGYKLFDAINHIIHYITGVENATLSKFHGAGGAAEKYLITNGFQIRNFEIGTRPVKLSLKDLLEGLNVIFFDGVQYTVRNGKTMVMVEPAPDMFKGKPITHLQEVYDYEEDHSEQVTYNELEIGYQKFAEDDLNTLDEFNTFGAWLTPITTYKKKYSKRTNLIASGYMIEQLRREQYAESPSTSKTGDEDIFIISYLTERIYKGITIELGGEFARFTTPIGLRVGDSFRVFRSGSPNPGTVFTVQAIDFNVAERYKITPNALAEAGIGDLEIIIDKPVAERNENFEIVENLVSPETAYNLRLTPKRIMYNHSQWIECGLPLKDSTQVIRNTDFKNNGQLITKFKDNVPNKLTDDNYVLKEIDNVVLGEFNNRRRLFLPVEVNFKADMPYNIFVKVRDALMHQSGTDMDGGTVTYRHPKTNLNWEAVVQEVAYEPKTGVATIKAWKKKVI